VTASAAAAARRARWLLGATLAWNLLEALLSLGAGIGAGSIALVGFGFDSIIESVAAGLVLWRFTSELAKRTPEAADDLEQTVHQFVGVTFFALGVYVTMQAGWTLWQGDAPERSPLGITIAALSLLVMPLLARAKLRTADTLGSDALRAEAKESLACAWLSATVLVGLLANAALGWWWADPIAALVMVPWLFKEGHESFFGDED